MHFLKNARGYTFVEAIFQLIVMLLLAQLFVFIVLWYAEFQDIEAIQDEINWELFVIDVREYLLAANEFVIINDGQAIRFQVMDEGEMRTFIVEKSPMNHVRKRSPAGGNEIMYPHVRSLTFRVEDYELYMALQLVDGRKRERIFIVPTDE